MAQLYIPRRGNPGANTWPAGGDRWKRPSPPWDDRHYNPETNLTFWGTGNAAPSFGDQRPSDNLYTAAVVAFDANSGASRATSSTTERSWDWDEVSPAAGAQLQPKRTAVKGLITTSGAAAHLVPGAQRGKITSSPPALLLNNVFESRLDRKNRAPQVDLARKPRTGKISGGVHAHCGAARTGRPPPTARRRACCTSP